MKSLDLKIKPEDDERIRALKELLKYGGHREGCDQSNEGGPPDVQHLCCSCDWCVVADWAHMGLLLQP